MKKFIIWLGRVPSSIRLAAKKALKASTFVLQILKSDKASMVVALIPGDWDNSLRIALIAILEQLNATIKVAKTEEERQMIAGKIGASITEKLYGDKNISKQEYTALFEKVYKEEKDASRV